MIVLLVLAGKGPAFFGRGREGQCDRLSWAHGIMSLVGSVEPSPFEIYLRAALVSQKYVARDGNVAGPSAAMAGLLPIPSTGARLGTVPDDHPKKRGRCGKRES
jgi:hypothetical protein